MEKSGVKHSFADFTPRKDYGADKIYKSPLNSAIARYFVEYSASFSSTMSAISGLRALRTNLL